MNSSTRRFAATLLACSLVGTGASAQESEYTVRIPVRAAEHAPYTTDFDFGTVIVGSQPSRGFTFTNRSAKPSTVGAVQAVGKARILEHNCTGTLEPNQTCALTLALQADALGVNTGSVSVSHSQADAPDLYNLSVKGIDAGALLRFDEATVNYGNQLLRVASEPRVLTLRNRGGEDVDLDSVRFARSTSHYLLLDSTCEGTVPAGGACEVSVAFRPQALGPVSASLSYALADGTVVNGVSLLGTGVQGMPLWSTTELSFTNVAAGQESAPKTATLTNTGLGPLGLTSLTLKAATGDTDYFWISETTCGDALLPGASCQVSIKVSAPDTSFRNATLELQASGTTSPLTRVQVWARPVTNEPLLVVEPGSLAFGDVPVGAPKTLPLTLRSVGQSPVSVSAYTLSGANAGDFALVNPTECVGTLNPGMQCVTQVRVTPGAAGARAATLALTHTSNQPVPALALSANGLLGELQVMPASLSFTPIYRGATSAQSLELKNVGAASVRISSLAVTSPQVGSDAMFVAADTCTGRDLAAGASCQLSVTYAPTTVANHSATLTVNHTGVGGAKTVPLSGSASEPPAALAVLGDFTCPSPAAVGQAATCSATLSNPSTVAYTVTGLGTSSNTNFVPSFVGCASGATVNPGQSCTVRLSMTPTAAGTFTTTYRLSTTAGALAKDATVLASSPAALLTTASHGNVQIGAQANATHKLANTGSLPVALTMPATLGTGSADFTLVSHSCPATLAVGASCDIVTRCAPTSAGTLTRGLSVTSNASPAIAGTLSCQGLEADANAGLLSISPNPVVFAGTAVGSVSPAVTVTVKNNNAAGAKAVSITGATFSGAQASAFSVSSSTCYSGATAGSLASGATCTLTLAARPAISGLNSGVLQLGNSLGSALQLPLSVTGQQASFSVTPLTQDFGTITAGAAVAARSYAVTNTGSATGSLTALTVQTGASPVFKFTHNCPASIAAGASCQVSVAVDSVASASRLGTQTAAASVGFSVGPAVALNALATVQAAPVAAGTVGLSCPATAPQGQALSCVARITSSGNTNLAVTNWGGAFQIGSGAWTNLTASGVSCSSAGVTASAIPPGQFCTAAVSVTPASAGTYTLRVAPTGSATLASASARVTVQGPALQLSAVNHPDTQVGTPSTAVHTLTNTGPVSVTINGGTTSQAGISLNRSACTTLAPGQSCTVTTTCTFASAGTYASTLTLTGSPVVSTTASVGCKVQTGSATASPPVNPTTAAGGFSTSGNWVRLTNTGVGPVTLQSFYPATGWALVGNAALSSDCVVNKTLQAGQSCTLLETLSGVLGPNTTGSGLQRVRTSVGDITWASTPIALSGLALSPVTLPGTVQVGDEALAVYSVANRAPSATAAPITFAVAGTGWSVAGHTCPSSLASGASCQVTVRLTAPLTAGTASGTLSASTGYNALLSSQEQPGTARNGVQGTASPSAQVVAANVTLVAGTNAPVLVGQTVDVTHELRNDGVAPVRITSAAILGSTNQHTLAGGTCTVGASVPPGGTCTVVTRFAPTVNYQSAVPLSIGTSAGVRSASVTGRVIPQTDVSVTLTGPTSALANASPAYTLTVANSTGGPARVVVSFGATNGAGAQAYIAGLTGNVCGNWSLSQSGVATQTAAATSSTVGVTCAPNVGMNQLELYLPASRAFSGKLTLNSGAESGTVTVAASGAVLEAQDANTANNAAQVATGITGKFMEWTDAKSCVYVGAIDIYGRAQCHSLVSNQVRGQPAGEYPNYNMFLEDPDYSKENQRFSQRPSSVWPGNIFLTQGHFASGPIEVGPSGNIYSLLEVRSGSPSTAYSVWMAIFDKDANLQTKQIAFNTGPAPAVALDPVREIAYFEIGATLPRPTNEIRGVNMRTGAVVTSVLRKDIPLAPVTRFVVDEVSGELVFFETMNKLNDTVVRYNPTTKTATHRVYGESLHKGSTSAGITKVRGNEVYALNWGGFMTTSIVSWEFMRANLDSGVSESLAKGSTQVVIGLYGGRDGVYLSLGYPGKGYKGLWGF